MFCPATGCEDRSRRRCTGRCFSAFPGDEAHRSEAHVLPCSISNIFAGTGLVAYKALFAVGIDKIPRRKDGIAFEHGVGHYRAEIHGSAELLRHDIAGHPLCAYAAGNRAEPVRKNGMRGKHVRRAPVVVVCRDGAGPMAQRADIIRAVAWQYDVFSGLLSAGQYYG